MKRFFVTGLSLMLLFLLSSGVLAVENSLGLRIDQNGGGIEYEHSLFDQLSINATIGCRTDYYSESNNYYSNYFGVGFKYYPVSEGQAGFYLGGYGSRSKWGSENYDYNGYYYDNCTTEYQLGLLFGYKYVFSSGLYLDFGASGCFTYSIPNPQSNQDNCYRIMIPGGANFSFGYAW